MTRLSHYNLQTVEVGHYSVEVEVQTAYQIIKLGLAPSYLSLSVKNKVQQTEKGMHGLYFNYLVKNLILYSIFNMMKEAITWQKQKPLIYSFGFQINP
jgi:hypothetical protein